MRSKKRLFIVGAGSFGREMESWLGLLPESERDWTISGFLHSPKEPSPLSGYPSQHKVVGDWRDQNFSSDDYVLIAITSPEWKKRIWSELLGKVTFFTYISPTAIIGDFSEIGDGAVIAPNCIVGPNVRIGTAVTVNSSSGIGHDSVLGDFSSVMARVTVGGKVKVGTQTQLGSGSVLIPGISLGPNSIIGAGSVVVRDVGPRETVFGNPAKRIWKN